jgi:hypothetical protein
MLRDGREAGPIPLGRYQAWRRGCKPRNTTPADETLFLVTRHDADRRVIFLTVDPRSLMFVRWLSGCLIVSLLLAACRGGHKSSTDTQHRQTQPATAAKPAAPKPVRLTVEVNGDLLIHSAV